MALSPGTRFGSYEIGEAIGAGGMGEVYRATDTTLDRAVAIKTLPSELAQEPERLARFEREAKLLATLNHAHIGSIYGLDAHEGTQFIVMELVEGVTLEEKLKAGALPVDDALRVALQIAEALEAAHAKGVVHRDLKPANVMITGDGVVKVLDFGLAKAFSGNPNEASPAHSPALSMAMTQQGLILGTAGYMSPEQASGQATDQRADIWAFGVVLYEMLTGLPLFAGESVPHVLADVLRTDPDWSRLPKNIHPRLQFMLERCLEKKVRDRYHSMADARVDIEKILSDPHGTTAAVGSAPASRSAWRRVFPIVTAALVAGAVVGAVSWALRPAPEPHLVNRFDYDLPVEHSLRVPQARVLGFSRDGRSIVYNTDDGLYRRELDSLEARIIPGTEEPMGDPEFSGDGLWLAYGIGSGTFRRISVNGGAAMTVTTGAGGGGGSLSWSSENELLFSSALGIGVLPIGSGVPEVIIPAEAGVEYYGPRTLPDGDTLIFSVRRGGAWDDAEIVAQSISTGERTMLVSGGVEVRYAPTGHLVYVFDDDLFAVPFDTDSLTVYGAAVPVVQGILRTSPPSGANYEISDNGTLVYMTGRVTAVARALVWVDRDGEQQRIDAPPRAYTSPRVSPDGTKVALNARDEELDIWIWDLARENLVRLSFDSGQDRFPAWSPDGQRIAYSAPPQGDESAYDVVWQEADGTGTLERLPGTAGQNFPEAFLPDGSGVIVRDDSGDSDDLALVRLDGERSVTPLLDTQYNETMPDVSPNGRWLAYVSDESGRQEVYVRPFPDVEAGRWQVSTSGGSEPLWSRDGGELFYRNGDQVLAVAVETDANFSVDSAQVLFDGQYFGGVGQGGRSYDVSPDGERFLMLEPYEDASTQLQIIIVENWFTELERLVPTN